ncbi:MAG: hypothetical protein RR419_09170, partial [Akkermansia sp.]
MSTPLKDPSEFIAIRSFMSAEGGMGLSGIKAQVFALIYQYSIDGGGMYYGSLEYTAARVGSSKRVISRTIKDLLDAELILQVGKHCQGDTSNTKRYVANPIKIDAAKENFAQYWNKMASEQAIVENYPSGDILSPEANVENYPSGDILSPEELENTSFRGHFVTCSGDILSPYKTFKDNLNPSIPPSNDNPNPDTTKTGRTEIFGNRDEDQLLEPESSWKKLTSLAVNPNRLAESYAPYRQLIACGYTPAEIHNAWLARQDECERAGKETRYFPQLKKWLESQDLNGA